MQIESRSLSFGLGFTYLRLLDEHQVALTAFLPCEMKTNAVMMFFICFKM